MSMLRLVDADQLLGHSVVAVVGRLGRSGVTMVVAALSVLTETVGVLHAQIQALDRGRTMTM